MWTSFGSRHLGPLLAVVVAVDAACCGGAVGSVAPSSCSAKGTSRDHALLQLGQGRLSLCDQKHRKQGALAAPLQRRGAGAAAAPQHGPSKACAAFGRGIGKASDCSEVLKGPPRGLTASDPHEGMVTWACEVPGVGLALCDEERSMLRVWSDRNGAFADVSLAPLSGPVGAVHLDNRVYVACFGSGGVAGLAVVDPLAGVLEATYAYPDAAQFLHNVYAFNWGGRREIFVAALGNPWSSPPSVGDGLVRFDRNSKAFLTDTTSVSLHARSAVQQSDEVLYVLTQEPPGQPSQLVRLERQGDALAPRAVAALPARDGGHGGADVLLGRDRDTVFCTDRTGGAGKLYFYSYSAAGFQLEYERETGRHPRYTTILPNGDIVVCNKHDSTLTVFQGLAASPTSLSVSQTTIPTVPGVSFFIESHLVPSS